MHDCLCDDRYKQSGIEEGLGFLSHLFLGDVATVLHPLLLGDTIDGKYLPKFWYIFAHFLLSSLKRELLLKNRLNQLIKQHRVCLYFMHQALPSTQSENLRQRIRVSPSHINCLTHTKPCLPTSTPWGNQCISLALYSSLLGHGMQLLCGSFYLILGTYPKQAILAFH